MRDSPFTMRPRPFAVNETRMVQVPDARDILGVDYFVGPPNATRPRTDSIVFWMANMFGQRRSTHGTFRPPRRFGIFSPLTCHDGIVAPIPRTSRYWAFHGLNTIANKWWRPFASPQLRPTPRQGHQESHGRPSYRPGLKDDRRVEDHEQHVSM